MTRALLCSVVLLSLSCSSASSNDNGNGNGASGGSGNSAGGSSGAVGTAGSVNNGGSGTNSAGAAGTGTNSAGAAGTGTNSAGAAGVGASGGGAAGSSATGGAGGLVGAGGSAGAGVGGTGGTAGAGGTGPVTTSGASVTQWGNDIARTAHYVSAGLTKANMAKLSADTYAMPVAPATESAAKFAGEIAAIPLYLAATSGAGEYIVSTTQNNVYAFREGTGVLLWKHNIGANLGAGGSLCGTPTNHGIVSTPVIDAAARVIYVTGGMTDGHYEVHALNADTGAELAGGWPVDVSKIKAGALAFPSTLQIQRSALSLVAGTVYVAFGGYCGDQGNYHGWVVGVNSKNPAQTGAWATMDAKAGIWAPGGMASDGTGVFAVTGNVQTGITNHAQSDSEEIIRVTGLGVGNRDTANMFFPPEWVDPMNAHDLDFGSSSPAVVSVPNSTPSTVLVAPSKNGRVYFLNASNLGGSSGQFADLAVADTAGASVYTAPSAYTSASGVHAAITTGSGSQCPGGNKDGSVMSILLQPGATAAMAPTPKIAWCATIGTDGTTTHRSPVSSNSAGSTDPIVWLMNGSKLNGFDGETGAVVFNGGTGTCNGVHTFTQVIVANGRIVTAGETAGQAHLCSWSVH